VVFPLFSKSDEVTREKKIIAGFRVRVENVIGKIKRIQIISHRYRNRKNALG
jgi:hypothetical protein